MQPVPALVLASGSPRRREILDQLGIACEIHAADLDESRRPGEEPAAMATRLARAKADAVTDAHPGRWVLGADTLVVLDGEPLGKPGSPIEAAEMLARLAGRRHEVVTAICLARDGVFQDRIDRTAVWMRDLDAAEIDTYVATGEPLDRAGAYAIQGRGAALVDRIDGDFYCVMGLPVRELVSLLEETGATRADPGR